MKKVLNSILALLLLFLIFPSCTDKTKNTPEDEHGDSITKVSFENKSMPNNISITTEDSAYLNSLIGQLKDIERFGVGQDFYLLASVMAFKGDSITSRKIRDILKEKDEYIRTFNIEVLDLNNGYFKYSPVGTEATYTITYWNLSNGSKLIATESWGCGPICSSDLHFSIYKNGTYQQADVAQIIPGIEGLPKMLVPDLENQQDPLEFKYVLPQKGKDIRFCLGESCILLRWENGIFKTSHR